MKPIRRRQFIRAGLTGLAAFTSVRAVASACGVDTSKQPLGPFFPRPGTPESPVRENSDPTVPIYLANDNDLTFVQGRNGVADGEVVTVKGRLTDRNCRPIENAQIIIWQASSSGRYNHNGDTQNHGFEDPRSGVRIERLLDPNFQYWGKARTDVNGKYQFKTIVPGFYPANLASGWYRPPHIHFLVTATGHPQFVTQMYFRGEKLRDNAWIQKLNNEDYLLSKQGLSDEEKRNLIVEFTTQPDGRLSGDFLIQLPSTTL